MPSPYQSYMQKQAWKANPASVVGAGLGLGAYSLHHQLTPGHDFDPLGAAWMTAAGAVGGQGVGKLLRQPSIQQLADGAAAALKRKVIRP